GGRGGSFRISGPLGGRGEARRAARRRASKGAGGGPAVAAVKTSRIEVSAPAGAMRGPLAEPEGPGPFPAVLVLMEAFGLVPSIESVADRLAAEGYVALAPDLYYREGPDDTARYDDLPRAMQLMGALLRRSDAYTQDVAAATHFLEARAGV